MSVDEPETDESDAELYRLAQARRILKCYEDSVGRPAATPQELAEWAAKHRDEIPVEPGTGKTLPLYEGDE